MPEEQARSPPRGGGGESLAEEPTKTVYFVPIYAVAVVDPNKHVGKSRLALDDQGQWSVGSSENISASQQVSPPRGFRGKAAELEVAQQKRQKLLVMRKRGRIPEYDDDDPHKPTPKRLRNRMKAQKSRDKKKAYMNSLESRVKELEKVNSDLEKRCLSFQVENEALKNEVLESDPGAKEELLRYYEGLQKDGENTLEEFVENQGATPGKFRDNKGGTREKFTEITDHEDARETEVDEEGIPETAVAEQEYTFAKYAEGDDQEGPAARFGEFDVLEGIPRNLAQAGDDGQEDTMMWTEDENTAYLKDVVEQDILEGSHSSI